MSATHPTNLPPVPPQSDAYFASMHLISSETESLSVTPPPKYEAATDAISQDSVTKRMQASIAQQGQNIKTAQIHAMGHPAVQSVVKWSKLITACEKAKAQLEASSVDLSHNWLKVHFLKEEEKLLIQQQLVAGLEQVQVVHEAAQALCNEDTMANLLLLEVALKDLEMVKPVVSISKPLPTAPIKNERVNQWMQAIKNYLGPIALTGWGLIVQSGILSSDNAKRIPLLGGIIGFGLTIKESIDTCIEQAKTEDQAGLIKVCESLVETFMNADRIGKAVQETIAARKQADATLEFISTAKKEIHSDLEKLHVVAGKFEVAALESRLTKLEEGQNRIIALLQQKQSNAQPSTNPHARVDNPA